ncbi:MAG: class I SAM-dependent rRNA methyltransferase [Bacteroidales bacterium]|nr:class I SAM-dependent rRNA methyltransferase [Bacteroidales bacterium]
MGKRSRAILKSGKDQSVMRRHPWIFSGAIKKIYGTPAEGDIIEVYNNKDEFLAVGHYQIGTITIRILEFCNKEINDSFWFEKISEAYKLRKTLGLIDSDHTTVYRLVNAEGDNLPGLIIDWYDGNIVMQIHSIGMYKVRKSILSVLQKLYGEKITVLYDKSENTLPFKGSVQPKNEFLLGNRKSTVVIENGLKFNIDWVDGQKTGFFIDQRENRHLLMKYSNNRSVLNMFCYTGGFSVYAVQGGAKLVHSVDSSAKAIDLVNQNINLNYTDTDHKAIVDDAFAYMEGTRNRYDLIILDPPAFAKHQNVLHNALQGYKRLNQKAFEQIGSEGLLFTFSCSQSVSKENFRKSVFAAAANAKRNVRILHQLTQPSDHPVNLYHPEGEYLKGLVLYVS